MGKKHVSIIMDHPSPMCTVKKRWEGHTKIIWCDNLVPTVPPCMVGKSHLLLWVGRTHCTITLNRVGQSHSIVAQLQKKSKQLRANIWRYWNRIQTIMHDSNEKSYEESSKATSRCLTDAGSLVFEPNSTYSRKPK